ncbi:MAG: urease accessory protein UreE [Geminocystis sp.]|nr:urease accessory protein UreE [Geminocystis sp.]HIK38863.1 urease accessory protein UreE [Geminocystis sp. M7585_C2015_104]MCS7146921.1 urease accessory protein UreE [Geminocystis sp.]MCX8077233.1 urease accessory protein UreE [Geminocystis sp.]MDW8115745.1 urease accessory protein UreE [Geminocystis sp.]
MIVNKIIGNIKELDIGGRILEKLPLQWHETGKRLLRGKTDKGTEIGISLEKTGSIKDGDVIYCDEERVVVVEILPVDLIMIEPGNMEEMGHACFLLGNRHLTVFIEENKVFTPYDSTLWDYLKKFDFKIQRVNRKVSNALQISGHHH